MKEKIEEFKIRANRLDAWDFDVERLIKACDGDVDKAVALIKEYDTTPKPVMKIAPLSVGFNSKDGELHYTCFCGCRFTSGDVSLQEPNQNGTRSYCPGCKRELDI